MKKISKKDIFEKWGGLIHRADIPVVDYRERLSAKTIFDPTFFVTELENVYVRGGDFSIVLDNGQSTWFEGLVFSDIENRYNIQPIEIDCKSIEESKKQEVGFLIGGNDNYYHWLLNYLPRIMFYEHILYRAPLILKDQMPAFAQAHLRICLDSKSENIFIKNNELIFFKRLFVPTFFQNPIHSPTAVAYLRKKFLSYRRPEKHSLRVYLSRDDGGTRRQILNESQVIDLVEQFGYLVVKPGQLNAIDQIDIFSGIKSLISLHGAGLANMIHMQPNGTVIELQNRESYTSVFWELGKLVGVSKYVTLACEPDQFDSRIPNHKNIHVDLDKLRNSILKMDN